MEKIEDTEIVNRLLRISPNPAVAEALQALGYQSAHQIAMGRESKFVATSSPKLQGLVEGKSGRQVAQEIYAAAQRVRSQVWSLAVADLPSSVSDKLQQPDFQNGMPDYERLFGPLRSQDCKECNSIFGPGAYFVDLMNVVGEYISAPSAATVPAWFDLQMRRPDLWDLLIDCENANTEVSYLAIVNSVMKANLASNFLDGMDPIEALATANYPFSAPYNQPLDQTQAALKRLGSSLAAVYKALKITPPAAAEAVLQLSPEQVSLITASVADQPPLTALYGFHDAEADVETALGQQALFLERTGMTPQELEAMVYQNLKQTASNVDATLEFDHNGGVVNCGNPENVGFTGDLTIEMWIYPTSFGDTMCPIGKSSSGEFCIYIDTSGNVQFNFGNTSTSCNLNRNIAVQLEQKVVLNRWNHIAFTRNNSTQIGQGYLNGVLTNSSAISNFAAPVSTTCPLQIGYGGFASSFAGCLSEIRIWTTVRTYAEIRQYMYQRIPADAPGLLCYWPINEGSGTTIQDLGPNDYAGSWSASAGNPAWIETPLPFSETEVIGSLIGSLFLNQILGADSYIALSGQDLAKKQTAHIGIVSGSTAGPLTSTALYQIAQMKRLQQQTGWSWEDLDWALKSVAGTSTTISGDMIVALADMEVFLTRYKLPVDEATALWYDMKTYGRGNGVLPQDLWDRVFNTPPLMAHDQTGDQPTYYRPIYTANPLFASPIIEISLDVSTPTTTAVLAQLATGLQIPAQDLRTLLQRLQRQIVPESSTTISLTVPFLSTVYRYARLSKLLSLSIDDFLQLVGLLQCETAIWTLPQVLHIAETASWLRKVNMTVSQLGYMLTGQLPANAKPLWNAQSVQQALDTVQQASATVRVTPASFITDSISAATSQAIFKQLVLDGFVDHQGLVINLASLDLNALYASLSTGPETAHVLFKADPTRYVVYLQNTGSSTLGMANLNFDPFVDVNNPGQATTAFTIALWVQGQGALSQTWPRWVGYSQDGNNQQSPTITQDQAHIGVVGFSFSPASGGWRNSIWLHDIIQSDEEWIHIAWVVNDGKWAVYRNGVLIPESEVEIGGGIYLQTDAAPNYNFGGNMTGSVANVSIWQKPLTLLEIRALMAAAPEAGADGLIGYWPADEGVGATLYDKSGAATIHNGTLSGSYKWQQIGNLPAVADVEFVYDRLVDLLQEQNQLVVNGLAGRLGTTAELMAAACQLSSYEIPADTVPMLQGNTVTYPYDSALNTPSFSLGAFVYPTGRMASGQIIVSSNELVNLNTFGFALSLDSQNHVVFWIGSGTETPYMLTSHEPIPTNVWSSIVCEVSTPTSGNPTMVLVVNARDNRSQSVQQYAVNTGGSFTIGGPNNGSGGDSNFFIGHIAEIMIGDVAVDRSYAMKSYKKLWESSGEDVDFANYPGLVAWWRLNQAPTTTAVPDATGHGYNATLTGTISYTPFPINALLDARESQQAARRTYLKKLLENVTLAKLLRLQASELNAILALPATFDTSDIGFANAYLSLPQLQTLSAFKALTKAFGDSGNQLLAYFALVDGSTDAGALETNVDADWQSILSDITGWSEVAITQLLGLLGTTGFTTVKTLREAYDIMAIAQQTGLSLDSLGFLGQLPSLQLNAPASGTDPWQTYLVAAQITQAALESTGKDTVTSMVAQSLEQSRDRLAAWLIWELNGEIRGIRNPQDLYEYLLIDVQMSGSVKTSYLVSAMNSLQLYVNRCYNNLEPGVVNEVPAAWWEWMSSYRVWQANREVYLYPENYVDPSLRKFASPQFKNLLKSISKGQVNDDNVEAAFATYLEDISQVANLELVDAYNVRIPSQKTFATGLENMLRPVWFIAGRSHGSPMKFYTRVAFSDRFVVGSTPTEDTDSLYFGPWEEIGLTIASENITIAYAFGRLYIFWVEQSTATANTSADINASSTQQYQAQYASIKYAYQNHGGGWMPPVTLQSEILIGVYGPTDLVASTYSDYLLGYNGMAPAGQKPSYFESEAWTKVSVDVLPATDTQGEQIVVMYGDMVHCDSSIGNPPPAMAATTATGPQLAWQQRLYDVAQRSYSVKPAYTSLIPAMVIDGMMRTDLVEIKVNAAAAKIVASAANFHGGLQDLSFYVGDNVFNLNYGAGSAFLASYWPLIFAAGTTSVTSDADEVSGITAAITNGNSLSSNLIPSLPDANLLNFNSGSNVTILSATVTPYATATSYSISFWVKFNNANPVSWCDGLISMISSAGTNYGWQLAAQAQLNGTMVRINFTRGTSSSATVYSSQQTNFNATGWNHIAISIAVGYPKIYLNGVQLNFGTPIPKLNTPTKGSTMSLTFGKVINQITTNSLLIGCLTGNAYDLKYWLTALTSEQAMREANDPSNAYLQGIKNLRVDRLGNSGQAFLTNIDTQAYLSIANLQMELTNKLISSSFSASQNLLSLTYQTPAIAPVSSPEMRFIRINTATVVDLQLALSSGGIDGLMDLAMQFLPEDNLNGYKPSNKVFLPNTDFMDFNGAFGSYFWELFFYAPYLIAEKLHAAQRFEEAQRWYKYVFNPTAAPQLLAYWPLENLWDGQQTLDVIGGHAGVASTSGVSVASATTPPFSLRKRSALSFSGTGMVTVNGGPNVSAAAIQAVNPEVFTIVAWVLIGNNYRGTQTTAVTIINSQGANTGYHLYLNSTSTANTDWNVSLAISPNSPSNGWIICTSPNFVLDSQSSWHMLTGTFDGKVLRVYTGSHLRAERELGPGIYFMPNIDSDLTIGSGNSYGDTTWYFTGKIADIALYNRALGAGEVANLYHDYAYQRFTNRFWNFAPFRRLNAESLYHILRGDESTASTIQPPQHYTADLQMAVYQNDPFDPDAIARLRVNSYQKAIFMRYIQNLVAWGDRSFGQGTWESLTDATMQYVLASSLLGKAPVPHETQALQAPASYQDMVDAYSPDQVPSFLIDLEASLAQLGNTATLPEQVQSMADAYFCIPANAQMLQLWKLVADRLFKLRHGLSLTGQPLEIPLYAPAIDPAALVAAAAAGVNLSSASASPGVPAYRFSYLIQQAKSLAAEVQQLGNALLAALEKQDAEQLAELQSGYQVALNQMSISIKASQINQLVATDQALQTSLQSATYVHETYERYIDQFLNAEEIIGLVSLTAALYPMAAAEGVRLGAGIAYLFPNTFGLANGGMQFGDAINMGAGILEGASQLLSSYGQLANQMGQYLRRLDDWEMQKNVSNYQMQEINAQIQANQFALDATRGELDMTQTQYAQSQEVVQFLKTKFTNVELYQWMAGQVSGLYFQTYQLAYAMAQSAQIAYQYELNSQQTFLNPGAWNSLYQGLLAGDTLALSLAQMESAYVGNNARRLNVRKTYSLRQHNPLALMQLVSTGLCAFELNELLYDLDFPGHYNRKIKTLSVSIPAVVGPYQNIHATLVQTHNTVVTQPSVAAVEYLVGQNDQMPLDGSIRSNWNPNQEIVISTGVNDSGVFQVNLDDPQYLPFEGTGAVSGWALSIPQAANGFPLSSISDVIFSVEYTAQDGGITFKNDLTAAINGLQTYNGLYYVSMRQMFSGAWYNFLNTLQLPFEIVAQMFPQNLTAGSIVLGNGDGEILLFPILSSDTSLQALPSIALNGNAWEEAARTVGLGTPPVHLADGKLPCTITLGTFPTDSDLLLPSGKIDPAQWLDIALVIPFSGGLNW